MKEMKKETRIKVMIIINRLIVHIETVKRIPENKRIQFQNKSRCAYIWHVTVNEWDNYVGINK